MEQTATKEEVKKGAVKSSGKNTGMAIAGLIIFFVPLLTDAKDDPFVKFYVKQGLVLFICWLISGFLVYIPVLGGILSQLASLGLVVILIIGIIAASNGEQKPLPVIGQYADRFKF